MCSIGRGGPSIFKPDWWTGQMPECSSGIRSSHVKMETERVCDCLYLSIHEERKKERKKTNIQKKRRREEQQQAAFSESPSLSSLLLLAYFSGWVLSEIRRLIMMDQCTFIRTKETNVSLFNLTKAVLDCESNV